MLTPDGMLLRRPAQEFVERARRAALAMSMSSAFSTVAFAIPWPRTRRNRASSSPSVMPGSTSGSRKSLMMCRAVVLVS